MTDSQTDPHARPFSTGWTVMSVVLFLAVELLIGSWLGPLVVGKYVSPMFHYQVQMALHLLAFYLGGLAVGILSPGRRLTEPAVGAFISVSLVFLMSLFMPTWFFVFSVMKVVVAGGIGMLTALAGAWHGEKLMGNLAPHDERAQQTVRGRLRASMWVDDEADSDRPPRERSRE